MSETPRPQIMCLTEAAAARIRQIMKDTGRSDCMFRISVRSGGCAGLVYDVDITSERQSGDEVVEDKGLSILVDGRAVLFLLGTKMDYVDEKLSSGFVFNNPNQIGACGCGESVSITPASSSMVSLEPLRPSDRAASSCREK